METFGWNLWWWCKIFRSNEKWWKIVIDMFKRIRITVGFIASTSVFDWEAHFQAMLKCPCQLKPHSLNYLSNMPTDKDQHDFLSKQASRFARIWTHPTTMENRKFVLKQSDSLFVATKIDPKDTFLVTFSFLGPSCPFVVLCEHKELLVERFTKLPAQKLQLLSLSDAWMREFQVLPG